MSEQTQDLLGNRLTDAEQELLGVYRKLEEMAQREDLAPCALMNVRQAMVMMWNACCDLGLVYEEPKGDV